MGIKRVLSVGAAALAASVMMIAPALGEPTKPDVRVVNTSRRAGKKRLSGGSGTGGYRSRVGNQARADGFPSRAAATDRLLLAMNNTADRWDRQGTPGVMGLQANWKRYLPGGVRRRMRFRGYPITLEPTNS